MPTLPFPFSARWRMLPLVLTLVGHGANADSGQIVPADQRPALLQTLQRQLATLPSSHLVYKVRKDGREATLDFVFNRNRRYWLVASDINSGQTLQLFAHADLQAGRLVQFDMDRNGQASVMDLHELLRLDHPRNPWSLYARIIEEKSGKKLPGVDWDANQPRLLLNMQLDADKFAFSVGMTYGPVQDGALLASWLAPSLFEKAEKVVLKSGEVQLLLAKHRRLRIDADTGLLLEDSDRQGEGANTRRLRRVTFTPVKEDREAAAYQPLLKNPQIKEARVDAALNPYFVLFVSTLARAGVNHDIIASTLRVNRQEFMGNIAAPAAEYWAGYYRQDLRAGRLDEKFIATFNEMLKRGFNQYVMDTADAQITPAQYVARPDVQNNLLQQFLPADMENRVTIPLTADLQAFAADMQDLLSGSYRDALVAYTIGTVTGLVNAVQEHVLREGTLRNPLDRQPRTGR